MFGTIDEQWSADDLRINISIPYVLAYWAYQLGVTTDELRTAVGRVGPVLRDVKRHLDKGKSPRFSRSQDSVERRRLVLIQSVAT